MSKLCDQVDAANIAAFEMDLEGLTDPDQIKAEYREVRAELDHLEPWADALCSWARRHGVDLSDC